MSSAIRLRALGWAVDLVEIDPNWRVYGAGISVTAPTYRAFKRLGVVEEINALGFGSSAGVRSRSRSARPLNARHAGRTRSAAPASCRC